MNESQEFLTIEELAERLRVSTRTIQRLVERGHLKCVKVGRQVRFRRAWVDDWIERGGAGDSEAGSKAS